LASLETNEKCSTAVAIVQGQSFSVTLDNGSHDSNYISERAARQLSGKRYALRLNVRTASGEILKLNKFMFFEILIKFQGKIKFRQFLIFFIFPNLPVHFIIGRGDLMKFGLYHLMEEIDRADMMQREKGEVEEGEVEEGELEVGKLELDLEELRLAREENGDDEEDNDREFNEYVANLKDELEHMVRTEYADVFGSKPPRQPAKVWEMKLELIGDPITTPEGLSKVPRALRGNGRKLPQRYVAAADSQIREMLEQGIIEKSVSPISVPIHLTPKPGTDPLEMRFCLDCKMVNALLKRYNFPIMGMEEFLGWMGLVAPEFFIKLDLTKMYFQLPLEEESRLLTAFNWGAEKYQFTRVVMGMANSVGHAQNVMVNQILVGLVMKTLFPYLDDCLIPGNRTTHPIKEALRTVLDRFREFGLVLNSSKCEILATETIFLGHKISRHGVSISPKKKVNFEAVPRPVTTTNLRSFLALASYFRRFLPRFAETAADLYKITGGSKHQRIDWTDERKEAFAAIKKMVQESVILRYLRAEGEITLYCDASKYGFGGGIFQNQNELFEGKSVLTPIAFWGRAFQAHQVRWHTSDREMFAICYGILGYHHLLAGRKFIVYTDHAALTSLRESESEKINRMKEKLTIYDWTARSIKGTDNIIGDGMSRIFVEEENQGSIIEDDEIDEVIEAYSNQSLNYISDTSANYLPWIQYYHGERGHWSLTKTMEMIRHDNREWPGCEGMIRSYIDGCEACVVNEPRRQHYHGQKYSLSGKRPGATWAIDLKEVGEGYAGHKYVLVIIDTFSRRVSLFPIKGKTAEEATYYLWHHLLDSGRPESVRYDPGKEFNNILLKGMITFLGAQNIQTAAGDHSSNGIVERFMGELDGQLRRYFQNRSSKEATDWIWYLPVIAKNHNEMVHGTTGIQPNALHGDRFWNLSETERESLLRYVTENIIKAKPSRPTQINKDDLRVGDVVYISVQEKEKRNLEAVNWDGPFTISLKRGDLITVRERPGLEYHISRLKRKISNMRV
jgi:hypothetical protein